ncbi:MAG: ABC transporter permease subunit [Defluviitaleaceae bacterium]|nr:ABC transporter permease subunit [Defluviitaleaceae bacterium]MCL2835322.1 ABC transporter permease subunit [Defluviitaleaceae bacterium]
MYIPLGGLVVAFKDYDIFAGFWASPWADQFGFKHIIGVIQNEFLRASIWNTLKLSLLNMIIGFPAPILLAILINELRLGPFKKTVQTISYMPHFLSWISVIGLITVFFAEYGPVNDILGTLNSNHTRQLYLAEQRLFVPFLVGLNLWKTMGFQSIVFIATIAGIDPQLYEAAKVDGAGRFKQCIHITLPGLYTIAILLLVLSVGAILSSNFELVFGLQNPFIDFEVIDTVIYRRGLMGRDYAAATALGLVRGVIAILLTLGANQISKKTIGLSII